MKDIRYDGSLEYSIGQIGFVNLARPEGYEFEYKNGKPLFSFIYAENGSLEYAFSDRSEPMLLEKGAFLFIPKLLPYRTRYLQNGTKIKIMVFDFSDAAIPSALSRPILRRSLTVSELFDSVTGDKSKNTLFLSAKLYELLFLLMEKQPITKEHRKIQPALKEIEEKYFENQKVSYYAELCCMSESNFRLLFREHTGFSPIEYRNRIRISEARKMIRSGEFTVSEAAYMAGFQNMSFFYELYHRLEKNNATD